MSVFVLVSISVSMFVLVSVGQIRGQAGRGGEYGMSNIRCIRDIQDMEVRDIRDTEIRYGMNNNIIIIIFEVCLFDRN